MATVAPYRVLLSRQ